MRRRTGQTWKLLGVLDTAKGLWDSIPGWFKGMVAGAIIPGGPLAVLAIVQGWFLEAWPVVLIVVGSSLIVGLVTGLMLRGQPAKERGKRPSPLSEKEALQNGRFEINIVPANNSEPRFFVITGPVQNPTNRHQHSDDYSIRQHRAYLAQHNLDNGRPPPEFQIIMGLQVAISAVPKMLVERMELELMGKRYGCIDWESEYMLTDYWRELGFVIPDSATPGIHSVRIIATVDGKERCSPFEDITFPER